MLLDDHFEDLDFSEDRLINTSHTVARSYTNLVHWHPFAEILLSLEEGNEVELNFRKYEMGPNDFIISYPGDLHTIRNVSMNSFLLVQFPFELITIVPEFNRIRQLMERAPYCRYDVNDTQVGRMVLTIKKIVNSTRDTGSFREAYNYSLLLKFFSCYGKWCLENGTEEKEAGDDTYYKASKLMAEACLYISQNCTEALTIDDVAKKIGISRSYFSHLFKDYIQMTFVEYLTRQRIRLAESKFLDPGKKFIDIAFECGFTSISSFNRSFKKTTGISPREFRSAMIEKVSP